MLRSFIILLGLQLVGDLISTGLHLPVPGPVIGMLLLLVALILGKDIPADLEKTGDTLIAHIGLLFVPAGAGVSLYLGLIAKEWPIILVASFTSTVLTLLFCAIIFRKFAKRS